MKLENKNIIIISNEPWGDIWYSKQNWAYELSKKNKVYFLNSPQKYSFLNIFKTRVKSYNYSSNLTIIEYEDCLPLRRYIVVQKVNDFIVGVKIRNWLYKKGVKKPLFWTFDPFRFLNPNVLKPHLSIFMRVDRFQTKKEKELIGNIDGLILTANELLDEYEIEHKLFLSHGISEEEFTIDKDFIPVYESGYTLYVGNIDHRLDVDLVSRLASSLPNERFLFIGNVNPTGSALFSKLFIDKKYENVIVHGVEHFKNLKNYIYFAKACIAPMDLSVHGNAVHHHKTLQYLAMGKPVVSPLFNDEINKEDIILNYTSVDEAVLLISSLNKIDSKELSMKRIKFARRFTYDCLIRQVDEFLFNKVSRGKS